MPITDYEGEGSWGSEVATRYWLRNTGRDWMYSSSLCLALYCEIL